MTQPDTIVPDPSNPQDWDRYSYSRNNPLKYIDPSGHFICSQDKNSDDYCPNHGGGSDNNNDGNGSNNNDGGFGDNNNPSTLGDIVKNTNTPKPACEYVFSASNCQTVSKLLGISVLILDMTALGISVTGAILELVAAVGGPEALALAIGTYAKTLNPIENIIGGISLSISAANDFFITGESYLNLDTTYQGTPSVELVFGSDTSVSFVANTMGGLVPEGVIDSAINGGAVAYDSYRLGDGDPLIQTHVILTANGNLHFRFNVP
ncbi:MAG: hypothetical protein HND47_19985 [Chloroflexi bacterium]|nr:hypothetical protein [Chloroflexota bacterium]